MKKLISKVTILLMVSALALAGCSGGASSSTASSTSTPTTSATDSKPADSAIPEGSIVVYTNSGSDGRSEWITELAKTAGFNIEVVHIKGGELSNRIIAEKNNQIADLVFGLNAMEYERLKREDLLTPYKPVWADEVDIGLGDDEGYYYPTVIQPLMLAYNTDTYPEGTAPKDYTDLATDPKYNDQYNILGLGGGTSKSIMASIIVRYLDEKGTHGVSDEGWEMVKNFVQNGHVEGEGEDYYQNLVQGVRPISELWGSGYLQRKAEFKSTNVDFVVPEIGVPYVVEQTALFKNAKNPELAKKFIDWLGSAEVQSAWSTQFGTIPAHPKALETVSQEVKDMMAKVHQQEIDWAIVSLNIEQWMEKIELEFVK